MGLIAGWTKIYRTLASVRTGIILLLLTVSLSAVGTLILQRPTTEADVIQKSYTPSTLAMLDRTGLTDVYHAWYFLALLGLVSLSIIFVSIDRFPNAWRYYARPYRRTEPHFRAALPTKATFALTNEDDGLAAAERAFKKLGLPVERVIGNGETSLFSEKNRFSVFAVYLVHASLLMIFIGGIVDGMIGYRGYMRLNQGETSNTIELRATNAATKMKTLSFGVRCDTVGQETYPDGMPKKYWSGLAIVDNGKEIKKKTIIVNDPLVYKGVRLYQASMGQSGKLDNVELIAFSSDPSTGKRVAVGVNETRQIDDNYSVRLLRFVPDYYVQDGEIFTKSEWADNPAFELALIDKAGVQTKMWLIPSKINMTVEATPLKFAGAKLNMVNFTGLEVSYQPGQWAVWIGVVLMATGLSMVFYLAHTRFWAVVVSDATGTPALWVGGATNRSRDRFDTKFKQLQEAIAAELPSKTTRAEVHELAQV